MERLIFHVDVNSAYLSWQAVRHLKETGVDLREIPSAVGGDREKRTGIILAKSIPAKNMGVKTGEPCMMALRKCPELLLVKPDFKVYEASSRAFMEICGSYAPVLEKFSIDECFLDMTGTSLIYPDPVALAHTIKERIFSELGFTVNIGIGENKLCAKMASDFEKPNRVHTLFKSEIPKKLWTLPADALFMTGQATAEKLRMLQMKTIGDVAAAGEAFLVSVFGPRHGAQLYRSALGEDDSPVRAVPEEPKGYSISTTLEEDVTTREEAARILLALSDSVSARMRADATKAACIAVTLRSRDFKNRSHQCTLSVPTDGTMEIYAHACRLFDETWDEKTPLRLLGVSLTRLSGTEEGQFTFFTDAKRKQEEKLDKAVDGIRSRFGAGSVMRGAVYGDTIEVGRKYKAQMEARKKNPKTIDKTEKI